MADDLLGPLLGGDEGAAALWERAARRLGPDLTRELAGLIGGGPRETDWWQDQVRAAEARGFEAGKRAGYLELLAELKDLQRGLVRDLTLWRRRYHLPCRECRRVGCPPDHSWLWGRCPCPGCEDRNAATWGLPMEGDYAGLCLACHGPLTYVRYDQDADRDEWAHKNGPAGHEPATLSPGWAGRGLTYPRKKTA